MTQVVEVIEEKSRDKMVMKVLATGVGHGCKVKLPEKNSFGACQNSITEFV